LTYVASTSLNTIAIDNVANSATLTNHWTTLTTADFTSVQVGTAATASKIQVGDACWAFRVNQIVYFKPVTPAAFVKSPVSATAAFDATTVFDTSLKFALTLGTGKAYKISTADYGLILTITGLKTTAAKIYSTADAKKLLVLSYTYTAANGAAVPPTTESYDYVIKLYSSTDGTTFTAVTLPSSVAAFVATAPA
jgi:hypothetical protein